VTVSRVFVDDEPKREGVVRSKVKFGGLVFTGNELGGVRLFVGLEWETKSRCSSIMNRSARAWLKSEDSLSSAMNWVRVVIAAV
jgi:hypothetical protein